MDAMTLRTRENAVEPAEPHRVIQVEEVGHQLMKHHDPEHGTKARIEQQKNRRQDKERLKHRLKPVMPMGCRYIDMLIGVVEFMLSPQPSGRVLQPVQPVIKEI